MIKLNLVPLAPDGDPKEDGWEYCGQAGAEHSGSTHTFRILPAGTGLCATAQIWPLPIADFSADDRSVCTTQTVNFTNLSQYSDEWVWNFGDGYTVTTESPGHIFATAGTYTVSLTAKNRGGQDTEQKTAYITAKAPPNAAFSASPTTGTAPFTVHFTDASTGTIDSRLWDFGDGGSSTVPSPYHQYTAAGTYTVSLTLQNSACGSDTETKTGYITVAASSACDCSDTFTGADGDPVDDEKWEGSEYVQIRNNRLESPGEGEGDYYMEMDSLCDLGSDDFDIQVDVGFPVFDTLSQQHGLYVRDSSDNLYRIILLKDWTGDEDIWAYPAYEDPVNWVSGSPLSGQSCRVRLVRDGDSLSAYYREGSGSWVELISDVDVSGALVMGLQMNVYYQVVVWWDNFTC